MAKIYLFKRQVKNMPSVLDVAKAFLTMESMTHKKLQKLCYYAYSWHLALKNEHLFKTRFEAWIHGPVSPELYQTYKGNGWNPITKSETHELSPEQFKFLEDIYYTYGDLNGDELELLTHSEDPWIVARNGLPEHVGCSRQIDDDIIRNFYLQEYEDGQND